MVTFLSESMSSRNHGFLEILGPKLVSVCNLLIKKSEQGAGEATRQKRPISQTKLHRLCKSFCEKVAEAMRKVCERVMMKLGNVFSISLQNRRCLTLSKGFRKIFPTLSQTLPNPHATSSHKPRQSLCNFI